MPTKKYNKKSEGKKSKVGTGQETKPTFYEPLLADYFIFNAAKPRESSWSNKIVESTTTYTYWLLDCWRQGFFGSRFSDKLGKSTQGDVGFYKGEIVTFDGERLEAGVLFKPSDKSAQETVVLHFEFAMPNLENLSKLAFNSNEAIAYFIPRGIKSGTQVAQSQEDFMIDALAAIDWLKSRGFHHADITLDGVGPASHFASVVAAHLYQLGQPIRLKVDETPKDYNVTDVAYLTREISSLHDLLPAHRWRSEEEYPKNRLLNTKQFPKGGMWICQLNTLEGMLAQQWCVQGDTAYNSVPNSHKVNLSAREHSGDDLSDARSQHHRSRR